MGTVLRVIYSRFVEPLASSEEERRREFMLNVLLLSSFLLTLIALIKNQVSLIMEGKEYAGAPPFVIPHIFLLFMALIILSRVGFLKFPTYILISVYFAAATYTIYSWGVDVPIGALVYVLVVVIAGALVSSRFAIMIAIASASMLVIVQYLQDRQILSAQNYWKLKPSSMDDTILTATIIGIIALLAWLYSREIEKSLHRAQTSETALKRERDNLEVIVEERTRELKRTQLEKMLHLYRFADFGRLAAGLFHDFVNPLTAVSLNLEQLRQEGKSPPTQQDAALARSAMEEAVAGTRQMENILSAINQQLQAQHPSVTFSPAEQIERVIQMVSHQAALHGVVIQQRVKTALPITLHSDPIKFSQIVVNLIRNAIDAYADVRPISQKREIIIMLALTDKHLTLIVQDWGCGIPPEQQSKIFEPFYTTKPPEKGTGIGLVIVKDNVEKAFGGTVTVESTPGEGTTFTLAFLLDRNRI